MSLSMPFRTSITLSAGLILGAALTAQTSVTVVKDINTNPSTTLTDSYPYPERPSQPQSYQYQWAQMGGYSYFEARTAAAGYELFRTDGKTATLVADINKGSASSYISNLTVMGSKIYFAASDGVNGTELWVSDGTAAGTKMVKDIYPGSSSSSPYYLTVVLGKLVFRANDGANGTELWVSDGTAAGTTMLMDINTTSATASGYPSYIRSNFVTTLAFFYADDGKTGNELWVTNGTKAGTKLLMDINKTSATASSYPGYFQHLGAIQVVFQANDGINGNELWISDGTVAGTRLVADIYPGASGYTYTNYGISLGNKVIFRSRDATSGYEPFVTDGTKAGTMLLKDVYPGTGNGYLYYPCATGKTAWFASCNGSSSYAIYQTDGTPAGTKLYSQTTVSTSAPSYLYETGGKVFFYGRDVTGGTGYEICVTDGTTAKTFLDTWPGTNSGYGYYISPIAPGLFGYAASDGKAGRELWISDGTLANTKMIDINPPVPGVTASDNVNYVETLFGNLIFAASDGTSAGNSGTELYISDGTAAGTKLLKDIYPGTSSSNPSYMCRLGNYVYFRADDGKNGTELWRTDGTAAGTVLFMDINIVTTTASGYPTYLTRIGDKIYFYATDGLTGNELWVCDGTKAGTKLVKDIYSGSSSSSPNYFARLGNTDKCVFAAYDGTTGTGTGNELYITDGTAAGTKLLKDIRPGGTNGSYPNYCRSMGDKVYFAANDGTNGTELWVTDGTAAGTNMVKDIYPGSSSGYAYYIAVQDGRLYFRSYTSAAGNELWTSDGTAAGTKMYLDYTPGTGNTYPYYMTAVGSRRLYFRGEDTSVTTGKGTELMWTDVTATTPSFQIHDICSTGNSYPYNYRGGHYEYAVESGSLYFNATVTASPTDYQLVRVVNGGTAHRIGRVQGSSVMTATDPLIGKNMAIGGATSVTNPLSVLCLGVPSNKPASLGGLAPGSYAYFQVGNFFWIVGNLPGKAWANVFPVPNDANLVGLTAVLQAFSLDALKFPAGTEVTNGIHLTMGK